MIAWILYAVLVSLLVAAAAMALDGLARVARRPTRWVWAAALLVAVSLAMLAPMRTSRPVTILVSPTTTATETRPVAASWTTDLESMIAVAKHVFDRPLSTSAATAVRYLPASAAIFVLGGWIVGSMVLALLFAVVQLRFGRARGRWPLTDLHGERVRVAPQTGPVVIGLVRPEIVVPLWMLERTAAEQRVVIAHEREHVRARDTVLLAAGWAAVILMPWNAALWFMLSRLRLAVELDCDARVLRAGVAPRAYGDLLIDLAERAIPLRLATTALADDSSHLHQRILAMKPQTNRLALIRAGAVATVGLGLLAAACSTALPTDADVRQMDGARAEKAARDFRIIGAKDSVVYLVDGKVSTGADAKAISSDRINDIHVEGGEHGGPARLVVTTKVPDHALAHIESDGRGGRGGGDSVVLGRTLTKAAEGSPILLLNGVRTELSVLQTLDRTRIESVEVLKGEAALKLYGPDAAHGVITIKTK
ncbi:MAG: M56 family metallopeptidase [Gemmatimonadaceae bacterium]